MTPERVCFFLFFVSTYCAFNQIPVLPLSTLSDRRPGGEEKPHFPWMKVIMTALISKCSHNKTFGENQRRACSYSNEAGCGKRGVETNSRESPSQKTDRAHGDGTGDENNPLS